MQKPAQDANDFNKFAYWMLNAGGAVQRLSGRFLLAEDELMTQLHYRNLAKSNAYMSAYQELGLGNLQAIKGRADEIFQSHFDKTGKALNEEWLDEAKSISFMNQGSNEYRPATMITKWADTLQSIRNDHPIIGRIMIPFVNAPFNILQGGVVEHSPVALVQDKFYQDLAAGGRRAALAEGKLAVGSALMMYMMANALSGNVTGSSPSDTSTAKGLQDTGWQPYSTISQDAKGNPVYSSYLRLQPLATHQGIIADLIEHGRHSDEFTVSGAAQNILWSLMSNLSDQTYFKAIKDQLDLVSPDANVLSESYDSESDSFKKDANWKATGVRALNNTLTGFLPASGLARNLANDGNLKEVHSLLDTLKKTYPIASHIDGIPLEPKRNTFGEILHGGLYAGLVPEYKTRFGIMKLSEGSGMPEDKERQRLAEDGMMAFKVKDSINGGKINLLEFRDPETKQSAYDAIQQKMSDLVLDGKTLRESWRNLIQEDFYKNLPDGVKESETQMLDTKKKVLYEYWSMYRDVAQEQILNDPKYANTQGKTLQDAQVEYEYSKVPENVRKILGD
jgi:hypothetical protein